jgi:hypothetical protein
MGLDPRRKKDETDVCKGASDAPEKPIYVQRSRELSELISKKDHLIRAKFALRKAPDYRQRVKAINAEIAQIEATVAQMTKSFRINKGEIHGGQDLPVEFNIPDSPEYIFGGKRLAPNYITATGIRCPEGNKRVFRTKRPIDCGCGNAPRTSAGWPLDAWTENRRPGNSQTPICRSLIFSETTTGSMMSCS